LQHITAELIAMLAAKKSKSLWINCRLQVGSGRGIKKDTNVSSERQNIILTNSRSAAATPIITDGFIINANLTASGAGNSAET